MAEPAQLSRRRFLGLAGATLAAAIPVSGLLSGCSGPASGDTLKVGVVAPFSGPDSATGTLVTNSLQAAVHQLNATGGLSGRKVELLLHDSGAQVQGAARAYAEIEKVPGVVGVLWCGSLGLDKALAQIKRSGMPVISVFYDLYSAGLLYPQGGAAGRSVFQLSLPEAFGQATLASYAGSRDRGYTSVGLLHDAAFDAGGTSAATFGQLFAKAGLAVVPPQSFSTGATDLSSQLAALRSGAPEVVYFDGLPADLATAAEQLAAMKSSYSSDPTDKGPGWHPQLFVSGRAMRAAAWATTAGAAAKVGTLAPTHLGGLAYLPSFAVGGWMTKYLGTPPTGDEDLPADALYAVLQGIRKAGSSDRQSLVRAIEGLGDVRFASLGFGFSATSHVARTPNDTALLTIEYLSGPVPTSPAYQLGKEWQTGQLYGASPVAPTQLVRPTLAANRRAHPHTVDVIMGQGWGTQCTKAANGTLTNACKIH